MLLAIAATIAASAILAGLVDIRHKQIPDGCSLAVGVGAMLLYPADLTAGLIVGGYLLMASVLRASGAGDAKLGFGLGVLVGPSWLYLLGLAFILPAVLYIFLPRRGQFAFGPYLIGSAGLVAGLSR